MRLLLDALGRRLVLVLFALAALAGGAGSLAAQSETDVIRGKVTNAEGLPLRQVRVTATSIPGNVTREARTNDQGSYQIAFPGGTGDYIMSFALIGYQFRQYQIKRVADEAVLVADARLQVIQLDTVVSVATNQQRVNRNDRPQDVSGTEKAINAANLPPEVQGDIAAMAASLPGVLLVPGLDGAADGFSVLGLGADQNSITLNGMQTNGSNLPRDAAISTSLTTSPYDVSRGGFSGGNFNIRSGSGSNFRNRGMSLQLQAPQLQWTDRAAAALGTEYTNISLGGMASGPLVLNKAFYNVSYQLDRRSNDNQTLLGTSALGLQTAGIAMDSVTRFLGVLGSRGVPTNSFIRPQRVNSNGSVFGSLNFSPPGSSNGHSFTANFNGSWGKQTPAGGSALQLASASGDRMNWGGGVQGSHSGYLKMLLSETSLGVNVSKNYGEPYLELPSGRVRVNSVFSDGTSGVSSLTFGGNQGLSSSSQSLSGQVRNNLSWFDDANKHRFTLTSELQYNGSRSEQANNLLGTFSFNSIEDLEAGRPASFSRTLTSRVRNTGSVTGSMAIGDSYRRSQRFQLQYGLRVDAVRYTTLPAYNAAVEQAFGRRNDKVPMPVSLSPRIGFSKQLGQSNEIAAFTGQFRGPNAVLRGGIGLFANGANGGQIGTALDNTGLPGGVQQIVCTGPAAPIPDWERYGLDPSSIPDHCLDGSAGSVFSNGAPNVTLFDPSFRPQRNLRSNLSWNGGVLDARFRLNVEGTYSINMNQQRSVDLNFAPTVRFTLAGEDGRPVFVQPTSIVSTTGAIASRDARVSQAFNRVSEVRSDLQSRTAQLQMGVSPIPRGPTKFTWNLSYTYSHIREQVAGFSSTDGNPLEVEWARNGQGPHGFNYNLSYLLLGAVRVQWNGQFRSGSAYTPMVANDVNGDGYFNDRAFVFTPTGSSDPAVEEGMRQLLASTSGAARECLERQMGRVAERNSCRGPWSSSASLNVTLDRVKFHMPQRAELQFSISNPLGAADLMVNGSGNLKGWGQQFSPDQSLLYVRGFDASAQRYRYEVNQRFGATRPGVLSMRNPVVLTARFKYDLGPTRERQNLSQQLESGRRRAGSRLPDNFFRSMGTNGIPNPMAQILRQQDSLRLTALQADSIAAMNRRYTYRTDSIWAPVAKWFASLPKNYDDDAAYDRYLQARHAQLDMLRKLAPAVHSLLTKEQRRKLPANIVNIMDERYLDAIRNGSGMYVSTGSLTQGSSGAFMSFGPGEMIIHR
jgi:hypothetical protein